VSIFVRDKMPPSNVSISIVIHSAILLVLLNSGLFTSAHNTVCCGIWVEKFFKRIRRFLGHKSFSQ
jgi:hypothetical protein